MTTRAWYSELIFAAVAIVFVGVLACFSGILRHDGTCVGARGQATWAALTANNTRLQAPETCERKQP